MKISDCIHGKCYVWESAYTYLNLFKDDSTDQNIDCYIDLDNNRYYEGSFKNLNPKNIREATEEETYWLLLCKETKLFIPFEEAKTKYHFEKNLKTEDDLELHKILIKLLTT